MSFTNSETLCRDHDCDFNELVASVSVAKGSHFAREKPDRLCSYGSCVLFANKLSPFGNTHTHCRRGGCRAAPVLARPRRSCCSQNHEIESHSSVRAARNAQTSRTIYQCTVLCAQCIDQHRSAKSPDADYYSRKLTLYHFQYYYSDLL